MSATLRAKFVTTIAMTLVAAACSQTGIAPSGTTQSDGADFAPASAEGAVPSSETGITCWTAKAATGTADLTFTDVTEAAGLIAPLTGMYAHAAAWGDSNGDGIVDLFVGTFADRTTEQYAVRGATGPSPDRLILGQGEAFATAPFPEAFGRASGAAFVDLDNDGDLDLVVSRNAKILDEEPFLPAHRLPTTVYESVEGAFVERPDSGIDPELGGRSVAVLDYNQDQLYDLFILEDRYRGGSSRLYQNLGNLQFADVTEQAGIPLDLNGLGVATADIDGDRDVDIFIGGTNQLLIADGDGFQLADSTVFSWPPFGNEDDPAGVAFGDVDRDGRPDLVVGQHFGSSLNGGPPVPVRLFLNRTESPNKPIFVEVTDPGLTPLPTKAPHVEIVDFDNDGWPDILTSASAANGTRPAIFRNLGASGDTVTFQEPEGIGSEQYWVTAPAADYDRDGRIDILAVEWFPTLPSMLLRNESASGNWLTVSVGAELGYGLGGRVIAYEQGELANPSKILGSAEITATRGYVAGVEASAHLGFGAVDTVDLEILTPRGEPITLTNVATNQSIRVPAGCDR